MTNRNLFNFTAVAAALALTAGLWSCGDEPQPVDPTQNNTFEIAPTFTAPASSATPDVVGLFAFDTGEKSWNSVADKATPDLMYNQPLSRVDGKWTYDNPGWPNEESRISLFAYSPMVAAGNGVTVSDESDTGVPVLTYDMGPSKGRTDIFIGANTDRRNNGRAVGIPMRSVMTKIGFKLKGSGQKVTEIFIRGVIEKASIAMDALDNGTMTWTLGDPTDSEFPIGLRFDKGKNYVTATATETNITADDGYLFLLPQNFGYDMRIVATVDGKRMGLPLQSSFQINPGGESIISVDLAAEQWLDYTDNGRASFFFDTTDVALAKNVTWAQAKAQCPEGYRLPTYNEGLAILTYVYGVSNNKYRIASYWCSTLLKGDTGQAMGYDPFRQMALYMAAAGITAGRCVMTNPSTEKKYPYVDTSNPDGPVIVSRDADGGVNERGWFPEYGSWFEVFHDNWTSTPTHDITTMADRISRKLQIANEDASAAPVRYKDMTCPDGWRTPTHVEIMMIYAMGGAEADKYDTSSSSVHYNPPMTDTPLHSAAGFTPLAGEGYWVSSTLVASGNRAPVYWPFTETPMRATGNDTDNNELPITTSRVRCVRDIE